MKTYNLFISHSWTYESQYNQLVNLLDKRSYFSYKNYSVPKDDPVHNAANDRQLRDAIQRQMDPSSVVIILAGVYSTYSKWINIEIKLARKYPQPKSILAIEPRGSERISQHVKDNADMIVKWNTKSIVSAIRDLA